MAKSVIQSMVVIITGILFVGIVQAGTDDSNLKEVGIEFIQIYSPIAGNLVSCPSDARGFYNALGSIGWTKKFEREDNAACEKHFKFQSLGGVDYQWTDDIDFAFFCGHGQREGNEAWILFTSACDDQWLKNKEVVWGDKDLEWITLDACSVLNNGDGKVFQRWGRTWSGSPTNVFSGLHMIQGFGTIINDHPDRGRLFVEHMKKGKTIRQLWFDACDDTVDYSGSRRAVAMYACDAYDDPLPGYGSVSNDNNYPNCLEWTPYYCYKK